MSQCTCITDKEITCIVHPTEQSLKQRIAELEAEQTAWRMFTNEAEQTLTKADKKIARLLHENQRLREALRLAASSEELAAYSKILGYDLAELLEEENKE